MDEGQDGCLLECPAGEVSNFSVGMVWSASIFTGFSSQIGTKLRDLAIWQAKAGCYSRAAMSSNDSKTLYIHHNVAIRPARIFNLYLYLGDTLIMYLYFFVMPHDRRL